MATLDDTTATTRFDSFNVFRTTYKKVENQDIELGILIPKHLKSGKHPVLVKFHGGGLVTGDCLYSNWIGAFFIPFIHRNNAITVLPNYRLLPEHTGSDIAEDLRDFWKWFHGGGLTEFLTSQEFSIDVDFDRVLVSGDSAGGYMALMSAMTEPKDGLKAVLAQYPMTNYLRRTKLKPGTDNAPDPKMIDDHIRAIKPGTVMSSDAPPSRSDLSYAMSFHGRYLEFFGNDEKLWPIHLLEDMDWMPPTWIIHGDQDTAVEIEDSEAFVEKWKNKRLESEIRFDVRPGEEHGFDIEIKENEQKWLKDGLTWIESKWLA